MREYTITKITGNPNLDAILRLEIDTLLWIPELPITAKSCYDDRTLYVCLVTNEPVIRAEHAAPHRHTLPGQLPVFFLLYCPQDSGSMRFG